MGVLGRLLRKLLRRLLKRLLKRLLRRLLRRLLVRPLRRLLRRLLLGLFLLLPSILAVTHVVRRRLSELKGYSEIDLAQWQRAQNKRLRGRSAE